MSGVLQKYTKSLFAAMAKSKKCSSSSALERIKTQQREAGVSHRRISASLLCPYVKVFVLFKTARRQEEKKQLDPWIVPASGSASGILASPLYEPANSARLSRAR